MKLGKKVKQPAFLTVQKSNNKLPSQNSTIKTASNEHRKLLQYRDYLMSLRKMDLGSLIRQNKCKKKEQPQKKHQDRLLEFSKTQPLKSVQQTDSSQHTHQGGLKYSNHTSEKQKSDLKQCKINLTRNPQELRQNFQQQKILLKCKQQKDYDSNIFKEVDLNRIQTKQPNINSFKLYLNSNLKDDDLYCNEDMDELMSGFKPCTPRLMHISNYQNNSGNRNFSAQRSSRYRDFSMPSIEEKNLSEQSQETFVTKDKICERSVSDLNQRKYNSCTHSNSANQQFEIDVKEKSKKKSIVQLALTSRSRTRLQTNKISDRENLLSTKDANSQSENKSARQKIHQNITTNPFNFKSEIKTEKQHKKLSLNVSEIVKRINSRQSKSSMSDRSYRKKNQNSQTNSKNTNKKDLYDQDYGNEIKQKMVYVNFDNSKIIENNKSQINQMTKRKSFKTQVRQFRQKHYLMMKLSQ